MIATARILPEPNNWTLVETFFAAYLNFLPVHETYESRVLEYAFERGVDRRRLQLKAEEVSQLIDFDQLEALRDGSLFEFKATTHSCLRDLSLKNRDKLDRFANELFHNASILKEHQFMVSTYATHYDEQTEHDEYRNLLAEVHEEFPTLMHRLQLLFTKAQERLEAMMPQFSGDQVFTRSLFLYGGEIFSQFPSYPNGIEDIYRLVYQKGGAVQGYLDVAKSFRDGGFHDLARRAVAKGIEAFRKLEATIAEGNSQAKAELFELFLDLENVQDELADCKDRPESLSSEFEITAKLGLEFDDDES
jgi:hypothetical protein